MITKLLYLFYEEELVITITDYVLLNAGLVYFI